MKIKIKKETHIPGHPSHPSHTLLLISRAPQIPSWSPFGVRFLSGRSDRKVSAFLSPPSGQSSPAAACACGRPLPPDPRLARAWRRPAPSLAYPRLPLRPPTTAAACIPAKARQRSFPTVFSTHVQKGPRRRCPPPTHPPLALCHTKEEG
jgi:hypothetical protein